MADVADVTDFVPQTHHLVGDKDGLLEHLDSLLEQYLRTIHQYEKVNKELSEQLSSGYMSLAQANFHNTSSASRYGQDCYDERMQATRKVTVLDDTCERHNGRTCFIVQSTTTIQPDRKATLNSSEGRKYRKEVEGQGSLFKHTPVPDDPPETNAEEEKQSTQEPNDTEESTKSKEKPNDPLRWFGILVPPALRTAQSTFVGAVEGPIPQLATITRELRTQEIEIGRVKKQIKKL